MASAKETKIAKQVLGWCQDYGAEIRPAADALSKAVASEEANLAACAAEALYELAGTTMRGAQKAAFKKQNRSMLWAAKDLLKICQQKDAGGDHALGQCLLALASVNLLRAEPDAPLAAIKAATEARSAFQAAGAKRKEASALRMAMEAYGAKAALSPFDDASKKPDLDSASSMGTAACDLLQELREQEEEAAVLARQAELMLTVLHEETYAQAEQLAEEATLLYRELQQPAQECETMLTMVAARLQLSGSEEALRTCREAVADCSRDLGARKSMVGRLQLTMSSLYMGKDPADLGQAAKACADAAASFKEFGDNRGVGEALVQQMVIQRLSGDFSQALQTGERAAAILQRSSDGRLRAKVMLEQAKVQFDRLLNEVETDTRKEREAQHPVHHVSADDVQRRINEYVRMAKQAERLFQEADDEEGVEEVKTAIRASFDRAVDLYKSIEAPAEVITYLDEDGRTVKRTEKKWNLDDIVPSLQAAKEKAKSLSQEAGQAMSGVVAA